MNLYKSSAMISPETCAQGFRELHPSGWGKTKVPRFKSDRNACYDNGEADCSSLYVSKPRADYVRRAEGKAKIFAAAVVSSGKVKAPICPNCSIPRFQCTCD